MLPLISFYNVGLLRQDFPTFNTQRGKKEKNNFRLEFLETRHKYSTTQAMNDIIRYFLKFDFKGPFISTDDRRTQASR